ncbi:ABC transporter ATP-binding protein [Bacillus sp. FJAT-50079]|uniref:ATP-binding cassette domain-containing protein n=1 Tax=Bacillus sp. FJAT-50079 TaxID=2833577 RepID=UPI001BC92563|nr:ABC transporter ATP-binding protein [Bacillus sp. FJAT-50079]MBS4210143.1 ABC transporter ATP-binding protein [Bacillus sp. FJAT-50079]
MEVIKSMELTKKYGRATVLDHMSFAIRENTITGLIGRNGVGKTTLLKILAGFIHKTSGEVTVFSERPFNSLIVSANSIMIDDQMTWPPSMNLTELMASASSFYPNWNAELANGMIEYFSLNPNQSYERLSKGMKSTFNLIIGICARCSLTILDEPTTGMDAAVRQDFYRALLKDYLAHPRTIILSSHHLHEIEHLLEDVLLMNDGKVHLHLPIAELKERAVGLQGIKSAVVGWTMGRNILHEKEIAPGRVFSVVRNDFTEADFESARLEGVEISSISANDVCIYETNKNKGGIDDVFHRNESD